MGKVVADITMSLDGFVAGPNPTLEEPLGRDGEELHEWALETAAWREQHGLEGGEANVDSEVMAERVASVGAHVMGRKMFSGGSGPWRRTRGQWDGGAMSRLSTHRSSSSPITRGSRRR